MQAKATKFKRYDQRIEQYRTNRLFQQDQKRVYQQPNGKIESSEKPDTEESRRLWSIIWETGKSHNNHAEWLKELRSERNKIKLGNIKITTEMVTQQTRKVPRWKCPEPDGVQGYWLKNFPALHERIEAQINDMINNGMDIPKWMTTGKTIFFQKDPDKGNVVDNYQSILCLPFMWKLMTGIIANSVYEYLEVYNLIPVEQKGCRRNIRGTKDQFLIDKMVLTDCKKRHTNLGMVWNDYRKDYMIPHS